MIIFSFVGCFVFSNIQQSKERAEAKELMQALRIQAPEFVHKGEELNIEVSAPPELSVQLPPLPTTKAGTFDASLKIHYKSVEVPFPFSYKVAEKNASPWLPLAVGNKWSYDKIIQTTETKARILIFIPIQKRNTDTQTEALTLEVLSESLVEGHYEFDAKLTLEGQETLFKLAPIDGETYFWNKTSWQPFLLQNNEVHEEHLPTETLSCSIPSLGLKDCLCYAKPKGANFAPPGPIYCNLKHAQTKKADRVAQIFLGLATGGLFTVGGGEEQKVWLRQASYQSKQSNPIDENPFWKKLRNPEKYTKTKWIRHFNALSSKHQLDVEVAGALYQTVQDEYRRGRILAKVQKSKDRKRLLRLSESTKERLSMEIALDLTSAYPFSAYVFKNKEALQTQKKVQKLMRSAPVKSFDPKADGILFSVLPTEQITMLCVAMQSHLSLKQRKEWLSGSDQSELMRIRYGKHLGLPIDPFLSEIIDSFNARMSSSKYIPIFESALKKAKPSIEATKFIFKQFNFDKDRLKTLELITPHLPQEGRESLIPLFVFPNSKRKARKMLNIQ